MWQGGRPRSAARRSGGWRPRWLVAVGAAVVFLAIPGEGFRADNDTVIPQSIDAVVSTTAILMFVLAFLPPRQGRDREGGEAETEDAGDGDGDALDDGDLDGERGDDGDTTEGSADDRAGGKGDDGWAGDGHAEDERDGGQDDEQDGSDRPGGWGRWREDDGAVERAADPGVPEVLHPMEALAARRRRRVNAGWGLLARATAVMALPLYGLQRTAPGSALSAWQELSLNPRAWLVPAAVWGAAVLVHIVQARRRGARERTAGVDPTELR